MDLPTISELLQRRRHLEKSLQPLLDIAPYEWTPDDEAERVRLIQAEMADIDQQIAERTAEAEPSRDAG